MLGTSSLARRLDPALHPPARLVDPARLPGCLRGEQGGADGSPSLLVRFEDFDHGFGLSESGIDVAGHPVALGQKQPGLSFERSLARILRVFEVVKGDLRDSDRVLGAEGVERLLRELQCVFHRLLGDVGL